MNLSNNRGSRAAYGAACAALLSITACSGTEDPTEGATSDLAVTERALANARVGEPYEGFVQARAGSPPYTWRILGPEVEAIPGLTLGSDGTLSGRPTQAGRYTFLVEVTDAAAATATGAFALRVVPTEEGPRPTPTPSPMEMPPASSRCDGAVNLALASGTGRVETTLPERTAPSDDTTCAHVGGEAITFYAVNVAVRGTLSLSLTAGAGVRVGLLPDSCPAVSAITACGTSVERELDPGRVLVAVMGPPRATYTLAVRHTPSAPPVPPGPPTCDHPLPIDTSAGSTVVTGDFTDAEDHERLGCGFGGGPEVPYSFTLTEPTDVLISDAGGGSTAFALRGAQCGGVDMACSNGWDPIFRPALAAGTYHLIVEPRFSGGTSYALQLQLTPPAPRPSHDVCAGALPLTLVGDAASTVMSFASVVASSGPFCGAGQALHHLIEVQSPSIISLTTPSNVRLELLDPTCRQPIGMSGCSQFGTLCSAVVQPGQYVIRAIDAAGGPQPNYTASLDVRRFDPPTAPANDTCAGATPLTVGAGGSVTVTGSLRAAGSEPLSRAVRCSGGTQPDVFYSLQLDETSDLTITTGGSLSWDVQASVMTGACGAPALLGCPDRFSSGNRVFRGVPPGPVVVMVEHLNPGDICGQQISDFTLTVSATPSPPPPTNDLCTTTATITFVGGVGALTSIRGTTLGAGDEASDLVCPGGNIYASDGADVFFPIEIPVPARLRITPQSVGPSMVISLHGSACGAPQAFACSINNFSSGSALETNAPLPAGTYYLRIDTISQFSGSGTTPADFFFIAELL